MTFTLIWWMCCHGCQGVGRDTSMTKIETLAQWTGWGDRRPVEDMGGGEERSPCCHRQSRREPSSPSWPPVWGMRGSIAERVRPQKRGGDKSVLVAVNFQPMWEPQIWHWAIVQAYLREGGGARERGRNKFHQSLGICAACLSSYCWHKASDTETNIT